MLGGLDAKRLEAMRPEGWEAILAHSSQLIAHGS